jgi:predicted ATPase
VTFLFTDVEGSTKLLHELGAEEYAHALAEHRRVLREAFERHGGVEVDTQGDAFFVAFPSTRGALDAAREATAGLEAGPIRVRMGIHTGTPYVAEEGYVGVDVHRAARIAAAGHGRQILVSAATAIATSDGLRELGEHRLKDFDEPVPLYQLGDEEFPPLKTISNTNLPRPASSFVGRTTEVEEIVSHLRNGVHLLTLTGPGGSGKTRLAIEAAAELVPSFKAGVFWVGLAPLRDPALVAETIAQTLGAEESLADHIGERELLLLLDNLEQVVEAAAELASLVERCPNLRLLATSRELLRVRGEMEYPVSPLADPEAVELFCARARMQPEKTVHELCRALDNLPLALELAAARTSVLSPQQILERLSGRLDLLRGGRDADPRQQTLRAAIAWSHELLSEEEKVLFARLALFQGGCTLAAAEKIADADLDTLQSLVDKSLVRYSDERFWMLETIREYAAELLDASREADGLRRRHAEFLLEFAMQASDALAGPEHPTWVMRLDAERDNLRAALTWSLAAGESETTLLLAYAFGRLCRYRGGISEGRRWLDAALIGEGDQPALARSKALVAAAGLAHLQEDLQRARAFAGESLALARGVGNAEVIGRSLIILGFVAGAEGDHDSCESALEEAGAVFSESGNDLEATFALHMRGYFALVRRDHKEARTLIGDALARSRRASDTAGVVIGTANLGSVAREEGHIEEALPLFRESLLLAHELRDLQRVLDNLWEIPAAMAARHEYERAAVILGGAEALGESTGAVSHGPEYEIYEETVATLRQGLDGDRFERSRAEGRGMTLDQLVTLTVESIDSVAGKLQGDHEQSGG